MKQLEQQHSMFFEVSGFAGSSDFQNVQGFQVFGEIV